MGAEGNVAGSALYEALAEIETLMVIDKRGGGENNANRTAL